MGEKIPGTVILWGREGRFVLSKSVRGRNEVWGSHRYWDEHLAVWDWDEVRREAWKFKPRRLEFWFHDELPPKIIRIRPFTEEVLDNLREFCEQWLLKTELKGPPGSDGPKPKKTPATKRPKAIKV